MAPDRGSCAESAVAAAAASVSRFGTTLMPRFICFVWRSSKPPGPDPAAENVAVTRYGDDVCRDGKNVGRDDAHASVGGVSSAAAADDDGLAANPCVACNKACSSSKSLLLTMVLCHGVQNEPAPWQQKR